MLRNLIFVAILGCVFAQDVTRCAWGESYWCSSLRVAKNCGAVDHCISTVWKTTTLKQDSNDTCQFCENIFGDVKKFLENKQTEADIKQYLDQACSAIPVTEVAQMCQDYVDQNLPELFQLIEQDLDPQMICATIGLCSGLADKVSHKLPTKPKDPMNQMQTAVVTDVCGECKSVMAEVKTEITSTTTEQEVENILSIKLCANLGALEDTCKTLVAAYVPELMEMLAQDLDPATICAELGFCNQTAAIKNAFQKIHLQAQAKALTETGPMIKVSASVECVLCEFVLNKLDEMLTDNSTEQDIIKALDKVCSLLPSTLSGDCTGFVSTYGPAIFKLLAQEVNPSQVCTFLGLCGTKYMDLVEVDDCTTCVTVVNYVEALLQENSTEKDIETVLDKVCNFLPDTIKTECLTFVNTYAPTVITLILAETTPKEICETIGLCTSSKDVIVPKKVDLLGSNECTWGPSYWCASKENAKLCQAETHCEKHVWK